MSKLPSRSPPVAPVVVLALALAGAVILSAVLARRALTTTLTDLVKAEVGRDLTIAGGVGLVVLPRPGLVIDRASVAGAAGLGDAPLIQVERVEVAVPLWALLRGRLEANKVRLSGVQITLVRGRDGRGNWGSITRPGAEVVGPLPRPEGPESVPPVPTGEPLGVSPVPQAPDPARCGAGDRHGWRRLPPQGLEVADATLTWADQGTGQRLALRDLHLSLSPGLPGHSLGLNLAAGLGEVGQASSARISASARFDQGQGRALVVTDIRVQIADVPAAQGFAGPMELTGNLTARAGAAIGFDLALNALDLDSYLSRTGRPGARTGVSSAPPGPEDLPSPPPAEVNGAASPPPSEVPAVAAAFPLWPRLDGRLRIGRIRVAGLELRAAEVAAIADGGDLRLDYRVADFYGGGLAGVLRLDLRGREPQISLQAATSGFQVGPLLSDLTGTGGLTGRGDLTVSLATAGVDRATLARGLQGTFALRLAEGALVGVDLQGLIEGASSSVAGRPAQAQVAEAVPRTVFDDLSASAVAADGVLRSDDLVAQGPWFQTTGSCSLHLADGRLDCRLLPVLVKPPQGRGLKELEGVPIPIMVSGTLAAPVWRVDLASALREVARRKLDDRGGGLIEGLDRRTGVKGLGDMLRGLLGH